MILLASTPCANMLHPDHLKNQTGKFLLFYIQNMLI
jgi:hypothetical protein